jgi:hypothetical protein
LSASTDYTHHEKTSIQDYNKKNSLKNMFVKKCKNNVLSEEDYFFFFAATFFTAAFFAGFLAAAFFAAAIRDPPPTGKGYIFSQSVN